MVSRKKRTKEKKKDGSMLDVLHTREKCNDGVTFQVLSCMYLTVSLISKSVCALSSLHRTHRMKQRQEREFGGEG